MDTDCYSDDYLNFEGEVEWRRSEGEEESHYLMSYLQPESFWAPREGCVDWDPICPLHIKSSGSLPVPPSGAGMLVWRPHRGTIAPIDYYVWSDHEGSYLYYRTVEITSKLDEVCFTGQFISGELYASVTLEEGIDRDQEARWFVKNFHDRLSPRLTKDNAYAAGSWDTLSPRLPVTEELHALAWPCDGDDVGVLVHGSKIEFVDVGEVYREQADLAPGDLIETHYMYMHRNIGFRHVHNGSVDAILLMVASPSILIPTGTTGLIYMDLQVHILNEADPTLFRLSFDLIFDHTHNMMYYDHEPQLTRSIPSYLSSGPEYLNFKGYIWVPMNLLAVIIRVETDSKDWTVIPLGTRFGLGMSPRSRFGALSRGTIICYEGLDECDTINVRCTANYATRQFAGRGQVPKVLAPDCEMIEPQWAGGVHWSGTRIPVVGRASFFRKFIEANFDEIVKLSTLNTIIVEELKSNQKRDEKEKWMGEEGLHLPPYVWDSEGVRYNYELYPNYDTDCRRLGDAVCRGDTAEGGLYESDAPNRELRETLMGYLFNGGYLGFCLSSAGEPNLLPWREFAGDPISMYTRKLRKNGDRGGPG